MITLINPKSKFLIDDTVFPPLGLLYLAGGLEAATIVDLALTDDIPKSDIYGITATTPQINEAINIASRLDGIKILGGAHISATEHLPKEFDVGVIGPGEMALKEIVTQTNKYRRIVHGFFAHTKPNRKSLDLCRYHYFIDDIPATSMMTSFGCPFRCGFCSKPVFGNHVYYQSLEIIQQEIDDIKNLGFEAIMIFDDNFLLHPRFFEITSSLKEQNIIYRCFVQTRFVNPTTVARLESTGCKAVGIGIESGSDRILEKMNKPATVRENLAAIRLLKKHHIKVKGFFILGLPSEDEESMNDTELFLEKAELDDIDMTVYVPYPKSPLWQQEPISESDYDASWYKGKPGRYSISAYIDQSILAKRDFLEKQYKRA